MKKKFIVQLHLLLVDEILTISDYILQSIDHKKIISYSPVYNQYCRQDYRLHYSADKLNSIL